jgi:invasion protein IalB
MTIAQFLAPSLAAGLVTAGLGLGTITAPGVAEASGLRPSAATNLRTTVSPAGAPVETAGLWSFACSVTMFIIPGDTTKANYKICMSEAPSPASQNLKVAMVFGI